MAVQLVIRHNLSENEATFQPGELRTFAQPVIRIGRADSLECSLPDAADLPLAIATLQLDAATDAWSLIPAAEAPLFHNRDAVAGTVPLRTGDELRCGHWTFRFHKVLPDVRYAKAADSLSFVAKLLVGLILVAELGIVSWLPRQVQAARLWEIEITRQRVALLMDDLREENSRTTARNEVEQAARKLVGDQLDDLAGYIRSNQYGLSREQWRTVSEDLQAYQRILALLRQGTPIGQVPPLETEPALRALLKPSALPPGDKGKN